MSAGWIIAGLAILVVGALLWGACLWLARSWEVLDEDLYHKKLSEPGSLRPTTLWSRMRLWFRPRHRQLTYQRDAHGRYRRRRR